MRLSSTHLMNVTRQSQRVLVYSYYVLDILHPGHIFMLANARALAGPEGVVCAGILTDSAVLERKPAPIMPFEERAAVARALRYVDVVIPQETYSPLPNVRMLAPSILLESTSHTPEDIAEAEACMAELGGRVVVLPYWPGRSSTQIRNTAAARACDTPGGA